MNARESLASAGSEVKVASASSAALIVHLEQLCTQLCDLAFTLDRRGNPDAAELAVDIARRLRNAIDSEEIGIENAAGCQPLGTNRSAVIISFVPQCGRPH